MSIGAAGRAKASEKQSLRPKQWTFARRMGVRMVESILLPALMARKKREENCKLDVG